MSDSSSKITDPKDPSRKVAVVTGAGRGIGRALTDELLKRNYFVVAVVRSQEHLTEFASFSADELAGVICDVTSPDSESVLSSFLPSIVGHIDLLVNNAGFGASAYGVEGLKFEELDRVIAVSLHGPIRCVRACLPLLRSSSNGVILNISSRFASLEWVASETVPSDQATYAYRIGKAALNMFTSCLSVEMRPEKIRVLSIDPGKVKTRFGPIDADSEPADAARLIVDIAEMNSETGKFLHVSGDKLPW